MRSFADLQKEAPLEKFAVSALGTLYSLPFVPGSPNVVIRHFDGELGPGMVESYVDLIRAAERWIAERPKLAGLVRIEQPREVGNDFVVRAHHVYLTSTSTYEDWDNPPEKPEQLEQMQALLRNELGLSEVPRHAVLERVLARSLLEPSSKTYVDNEVIVVVEPRIDPDDVERWAALASTA